MNVSDFISKSDITGSVDKAFILFNDKYEPREAEKNSNVVDMINNVATRIDVAKNVLKKSENGEDVNSTGFLKLKVQYNPSSVSLVSRGGEYIGRYGGVGGTDSGALQRNIQPEEVVLSMELIFDDTVISEAFSAFDASNYSPTGLAKKIATKVSNSSEDFSGYSIRNATELFVAAMTSAHTRVVCVAWKDMVFWGELTGVNAEYTMFNNKGNPIRSKVQIEVRQDGRIAEDATNWVNSYKNLEQNAAKLSSSSTLTSSSSLTSNFLNLS